ncbi:MAG TPA: PDZ domain-containing protein, partial [Urbifossiella sp.]|nr:PDZ domain-containing protein [Urbifossiella sp.]
MVGPAAITLLLLAPAAPVPAGPPAPPPVADPVKAAAFGNMVNAAAMEVLRNRKDVELPALVSGAVRGMYETAGQPVPAEVVQALRDAKRDADRIQLIGDARVRLVAAPSLRGVRAYLAAVHGFRHAFDPLSGLAPLLPRSISVEMDFGLGFALDGVEGQRLTAYRLERQIAAGELPPTGLFEPPPRSDAIPSPASYPWRVRRVVPGGPAHRAGLRAGDILTGLNDAEVTAADADRLFARLAFPPETGIDPRTGQPRPAVFAFDIRRGAAAPVRVRMTTEPFTPTNVAGAVLRADGTWDGMLDPLNGLGYVRVGAVEAGSDKAVR